MRQQLAFVAVMVGLAACGPKPVPVTPATTPHAPMDQNPFAGAKMYVNPDYVAALEGVAKSHPGDAALLKKIEQYPTAIWLSWIKDLKALPGYLDDAQKQQDAGGQPVVPVFVVYDVPGRDCNAEASAGELQLTEEGEARYQHDYIDVIAGALAAHPKLRVAFIVEPDSLANLVTNMGTEKCQKAEPFYKRTIAYAIAQLSLPNGFIYLDAAHAGWLGWPKNIAKIVPMYKEVLAMAGGPDRIRGFALNVSNYDPPKDPATPKRVPDYPPNDEIGYANDLAKLLPSAGITGKGFVIDTGRSGVPNVRSAGANWCNIKGAGLGERPQANPAPKVDAYLWIKVPGESDGTADPKAPRYDSNCSSEDATPGAPQAGDLFVQYLIDLAKNAKPA
ncbi:MAG TPA: glycoside hydrolase family 6 protein, partial [Polyangia bacterium]|nr:glycoside hydrolase family 6 protein [Polyangia bacterium]